MFKNEGDLNAYFSKEWKKQYPKLKVVKAADKFQVGLSDFMLYKDGTARGIEVKLVKELPARASTNILKHEFAGSQITYLKDLDLTGNKGFGLLAVEPLEIVFMIPSRLLIPNGTLGEFRLAATDWFYMHDDCEMGFADKIINYVFIKD